MSPGPAAVDGHEVISGEYLDDLTISVY